MNNATSRDGFLWRAAAAWNDFFFRPGDPTTLGLMRIVAGVVVLYVHLAYTQDLIGFFGPKSWADQELVDDVRKQSPVQMASLEWDEPTTNFVPPIDREMRKVFFRWVMTLPKTAEQRREILSYLETLPVDSQGGVEGLLFAEQCLIKPANSNPRQSRDNMIAVSREEYQYRLDALTRKDIIANAPLPQYLRRESVTLKDREEIRAKLVRFVDSLRDNSPADLFIIFNHLKYQAISPLMVRDQRDPRTELMRTFNFLTEKESTDPQDVRKRGPFLPDELKERQAVLDYLENWGIDKRRVYSLGSFRWSIWFHVTNPTAMYLVHLGIIGVMALFTLGLWTRITSVLTWMGALCYVHRTPYVLFGMDTMMNLCLVYLMVGPSGAALSLDRWLEKRRAQREFERLRKLNKDTREVEAVLAGPRKSMMATLTTRLVQINFCFIYAASGLSKLKGPAWWGHTAIWTTMANPEFSPTIYAPYRWFLLQLSDYRWASELMMSAGAVYTLFLEIALPFLVWRPKLRPYMVVAAILLHTGIAVFMGLTVFGLFMMTLLMSFVPPQTVSRWLEIGEERLRSRSTGAAPAREPVAVG